MKNTLTIPAVLLMTLFALSLTSCRLDRSDVPQEIRQYKKIDFENDRDCLSEIPFGQTYIEFQSLDQEIILDEVLTFSEKYVGKEFDRESAGGRDLTDWLRNRIFGYKENIQFERGVLSYALGKPEKLMTYSDGFTFFKMKDFKFRYHFYICPTAEVIPPNGTRLFHTMTSTTSDTVTSQSESRSFGKTSTTTRTKINTTTSNLPFRRETYAAKICFIMEMIDQKGEYSLKALMGHPEESDFQDEFYKLELKDTIRVHRLDI